MSVKAFLNKIYEDEKDLITFNGNTKEEHIKWKNMAKQELLWYLKVNKLKEYLTKSQAKKIQSEDLPNFNRIKYELETFEGVVMPYYVLEPKTPKKNGKAAIAVHGHGSDGKNAIAGVISEKIRSNADKYNYVYGITLAEMGYTVYIPDLCGSGERKEIKRKNKDTLCDEINFSANAIGINLQGMIITELMRLTDIIEDDGFKNLLVCGFSGGGLFSLLLSALDERIRYTVSSGYFHSFKSTIMENNFCGCNFVPEIWKRFDIRDYASLIAPKKLGVEVGSQDLLNSDCCEQADYIQRIYDMYGGGFTYKLCEGKHKWFGSLNNTIREWINQEE